LKFPKHYYGDQIEEDEMGGACSTHDGYNIFIQTFQSENWKGRNHLKDLSVNGGII
jgi:hypothetical protein